MLAIAVGMAAPDEVGVGTGDVALEGVDGMVGVLEAVDDTLTGVLTETEGTEGVELGGLMLLTGDVELDAPEEVLWELEAALLADELPETDELEVLRRKYSRWANASRARRRALSSYIGDCKGEENGKLTSFHVLDGWQVLEWKLGLCADIAQQDV
ncbi:hypothetical protein BJ165DRAFT_1407238 [Panaeolus papilionaceus]|nr:hypothetical protein BJ165DRAFT_1407238 [Panaeolus papilionaceus]